MNIQFIRGARPTIPDSFVADRGAAAKLLVVVHGISRNAAELATRFASDPRFDAFTICAPLFEKERFGQYQQLRARRKCVSADRALIDLMTMMQEAFGTESERVLLFGFSGGAQMAHRFAMVHPDRVSAVFLAAAGWYLMPDAAVAYPYGLGGDQRFQGVADAFLRIPVTVAVGSRDIRVDATVRQCPKINSVQGKTRLARARTWVAAMKQVAREKGIEWMADVVLLPNGVHDFGQCVRDAGLLDAVAGAFCARNAYDTKAF